MNFPKRIRLRIGGLMWKQISLRTRLVAMLSILVAIAAGGGIVCIGYIFMMDHFFNELVDTEIHSFQAAQELENAVVMQKGYLTYYAQDNDPKWIDHLKGYHKIFEDWLTKARKSAATDQDRKTLNDIDALYVRFVHERDQVIALYKENKPQEAFEIHKKTRAKLFQIISLCHRYKQIHEDKITEAREKFKARAAWLKLLAVIALLCAAGMATLLGYFLFAYILGPVRQMALEGAPTKDEAPEVADEMQALSTRVKNLIYDVDQTKTKLKWSREHLQQAEKWALVGKLAAGVAHSVRNPLTSVKMRLFSMERTLNLTSDQKEDFEVISEEIRHLDTIVGNFLEFSRPPKLKTQTISPSDCVDMALQLMRHRLESYDVKVKVNREKRLPEITGDPDQLKEVLINLMVNACEAMVDGGVVLIEEVEKNGTEGPFVVIRLSDNGPGVPASIQGKLFQPFFSTKEEGTGLGLSIANRIIEEHGGGLDLESKEGEGTTFIITLPQREVSPWEQS
jgi:signal transduction histidine kinase